ncbi:MAG: pyridoxamine 5'-phosphate oxidase family protein, partial [Halobacteria archaeon]|nr:pyridoxamine 5'-phosphate oxidase family protein [Halobacteria archaeon]
MSVDDLKEYGLDEMNDEEVRNFLSSQGMGVLGLSAEGEDVPYLLPMSFGYDGAERLYFTYFVGSSSRKKDLTDRAERARFLVYRAESVFNWESILLTGSLSKLPEDEWEEHEDAMENAWHLDIFEKADTAGKIELYEFEIEEQNGIKHTGLP